MPNKQNSRELESAAARIFELIKLASTARARARAGSPEVLSEAEFLTLDWLVQNPVITVGDLQKRIGVLPAQMSRIIRSLEDKNGDAFVTCTINPDDRRKVDVKIAPKGRKAYDAYRNLRLGFAIDILQSFKPEDRRQFVSYLDRIRDGLAKQLDEA